jgi:hypothetical protein
VCVVADDFEGWRSESAQLGVNPFVLQPPDALGFTVDETARRHGAGVEEDTLDGSAAYASLPTREPTAYRDGWLPSSAADE